MPLTISISSTSSGISVAIGDDVVRDEVAGVVVGCGHSPVIEAFVGEFATVQAAEHEFSEYSLGTAIAGREDSIPKERLTSWRYGVMVVL